jgi:hypothetical protein
MATSAFGKAFRAAREAGDTEFEFGGKKYNTKMKDEDSAPAKKAEPKASQEFPKTPAPKYDDSSSSKSEPFKHKMPITGFFESLRERGNKDLAERNLKSGGKVKMAAGGMTASKRADGIAQRGKTRGKMC